jgi:hypothetical protein
MILSLTLPNGSALSCEHADRDGTRRHYAAGLHKPLASEAS